MSDLRDISVASLPKNINSKLDKGILEGIYNLQVCRKLLSISNLSYFDEYFPFLAVQRSSYIIIIYLYGLIFYFFNMD